MERANDEMIQKLDEGDRGNGNKARYLTLIIFLGEHKAVKDYRQFTWIAITILTWWTH